MKKREDDGCVKIEADLLTCDWSPWSAGREHRLRTRMRLMHAAHDNYQTKRCRYHNRDTRLAAYNEGSEPPLAE